jgi:hypothetical protein
VKSVCPSCVFVDAVSCSLAEEKRKGWLEGEGGRYKKSNGQVKMSRSKKRGI